MHLNLFLDPIQKRALSRSVQLEAVYLEALLSQNNETTKEQNNKYVVERDVNMKKRQSDEMAK